MNELAHICSNIIVAVGYTVLLFILLCLSIANVTVPAVTLLLSILWCVCITIDSYILFTERERLDYEALD